jgi:hypothetical protein
MIIETAKLEYKQLLWAAASISGSANFEGGWELLQREGISVDNWQAPKWGAHYCYPVIAPIIHKGKVEMELSHCRMNGDTPLIAIMRCFVVSKLGVTVDVPDELIK